MLQKMSDTHIHTITKIYRMNAHKSFNITCAQDVRTPCMMPFIFHIIVLHSLSLPFTWPHHKLRRWTETDLCAYCVTKLKVYHTNLDRYGLDVYWHTEIRPQVKCTDYSLMQNMYCISIQKLSTAKIRLKE